MTALTFLHIRGTLAENMIYRPRPGHESVRPGPRTEGDPSYQLQLLDGEGRVLVDVAPEVSLRGCGTAMDAQQWKVRGTLPMHPHAARYELRRGAMLLYSAAVNAPPPAISGIRHVQVKDGIRLEWNGAQMHGLTCSVVIEMESGRRITLARNLTATEYAVDLTRIPEHGPATLLVLAHDGVRSTATQAAMITVPARAVTLHILGPEPNACVAFGQPLSVIGACLDMGGRPCSPAHLVWSIDGEQFAAGAFIAALDRPSPGTHRLTLAYGSGDERVETSVRVDVEEPHEDYHRWSALHGEIDAYRRGGSNGPQ